MAPDRYITWLFGVLLFSSILLFAKDIPTGIGHYLTLALYGVICLTTLVYTTDTAIKTPAYAIISFIIIWGVYLLHSIIAPLGDSTVGGTMVYIIQSAVCVFWLPQVIKWDQFTRVVSRVTAAVVLVGLPAAVVPSFFPLHQYTLGPFLITHASPPIGTFSLPIGEITIYPMKSFLSNQNFVGMLVLIGAVTSLSEVQRGPRRNVVYFALCVLGVLLAHARTTILALLVCVSLYAAFRLGGDTLLRLSTVLGVCGGVLLTGIVFGVIPGPDFLRYLNLSGRRAVWAAVIEAFSQRPLIGYGRTATLDILEDLIVGYPPRVTHNAYFWMLLQTGLIGSISFTYVVGRTILETARSLTDDRSVMIFILLIGVSTIMIFEDFILFGIRSSSLLAGMSLGYGLHTVIENSELADRSVSRSLRSSTEGLSD